MSSYRCRSWYYQVLEVVHVLSSSVTTVADQFPITSSFSTAIGLDEADQLEVLAPNNKHHVRSICHAAHPLPSECQWRHSIYRPQPVIREPFPRTSRVIETGQLVACRWSVPEAQAMCDTSEPSHLQA